MNRLGRDPPQSKSLLATITNDEARKYFAKHDIPGIFELIVEQLLQNQPDNPQEFIANQLHDTAIERHKQVLNNVYSKWYRAKEKELEQSYLKRVDKANRKLIAKMKKYTKTIKDKELLEDLTDYKHAYTIKSTNLNEYINNKRNIHDIGPTK